jgi:hypothetical protein
MDCIVNYRYSTVICYAFSLPFMFEILRFIDNTFPSIVFSHVIRLSVKVEVLFKHEFFLCLKNYVLLILCRNHQYQMNGTLVIINCITVKELYVGETIVQHSKDFYVYFSYYIVQMYVNSRIVFLQ